MQQAPTGLSRVEVRVEDPPEWFWQSEPCRTCGAKTGAYCLYPSGRVAHTRHSQRDADVLAASAAAVRTAAEARLAAARG